MSWFKLKQEHIPDEHFLYTRIHRSNLTRNDKMPKADAFKNTPFEVNSKVLSSDWDKYTTPIKCRDSVISHSKPGKPL